MHSVYTVGVHDIMIGCLFGVYNVGIHDISLLVFVYKLCCLLSLVFLTHDWVFMLGVYNVGIHVLLWGIHRLWCPYCWCSRHMFGVHAMCVNGPLLGVYGLC